MNVQAEVLRLLLTDLSHVASQPNTAEEVLQTFIDELVRAGEELGSELSTAFLRERSIATAIGINRSECDVWEELAGTAADSGHEQLVQRATKRKNAYETILTALRDHQAAVQKELQTLQHQMAALQAMAAHAKSYLEQVVARKQQAGIG